MDNGDERTGGGHFINKRRHKDEENDHGKVNQWSETMDNFQPQTQTGMNVKITVKCPRTCVSWEAACF